MNPETIWRAFSQTGDPGFYLLYKAMEEQGSGDMDKGRDSAQGQTPRAED